MKTKNLVVAGAWLALSIISVLLIWLGSIKNGAATVNISVASIDEYLEEIKGDKGTIVVPKQAVPGVDDRTDK